MSNNVEIVTVDASNVEQHGFFCFKSKPKSEGYRRKLAWLEQRFAEGLRIKILYEGKRSIGFIEYIPGEYTWRAVKAKDYVVIHCLWVVGSGKDKGYGSRLLNECLEAARKSDQHGVAMVTSERVWLAGKKLFLKNGFEEVDQAPPSFGLLVKRFDDAPLPAFPTNWTERASRYGDGLTIIRSDQCPYIDDAVKIIGDGVGKRNIPFRVVELKSAQEAQELSPSAYGLFGVVYNGQLLSYHYLGQKDLLKLLPD
ncbi:MAG: GNAT family N-acetyltransferase [Anaerolineae bacterium]|nr:GNAT family N-acetyltransferase [Anaerolineae bacterium]